MRLGFLPLSNMRPSLLTKKHFSKIQRRLSAWSWSFRMMKMSIRKSSSYKKENRCFLRIPSGRFSFRSLVASIFCIRLTYFTVIWSVRMYFCQRKPMRNLVISMCQKLRSRVYFTLRPARLTMPHPRSGKINHTITKVIFGPSVASFTRWQRLSPHSEPQIWTVCINQSSKVNTNRSNQITQQHSKE
jgi:hypothetical protein